MNRRQTYQGFGSHNVLSTTVDYSESWNQNSGGEWYRSFNGRTVRRTEQLGDAPYSSTLVYEWSDTEPHVAWHSDYSSGGVTSTDSGEYTMEQVDGMGIRQMPLLDCCAFFGMSSAAVNHSQAKGVSHSWKLSYDQSLSAEVSASSRWEFIVPGRSSGRSQSKMMMHMNALPSLYSRTREVNEGTLNPWAGTPSRYAAASDYTVGGERPDNWGSAFKPTTKGAVEDVSPDAPGHSGSGSSASANELQLFWMGGTNIAGTTQSAIVGQNVSLSCALGGGLFPDGTIFDWSIPGYAVAGYSVDRYSGAVDTNIVKTNSAVSLYWVNAGKKGVTCTATIRGKNIPVSATFEVSRPSSTLAVVTTTNQPAVDVVPCVLYGKVAPDFYLTFGTTHNSAGVPTPDSIGIRFSGPVTSPTGGEGTIGFIQVVTSSLRAYTTNDGSRWKRDSHGTNYVDNLFEFFVVDEKEIGSSETKTCYHEDVPGNGLQCQFKEWDIRDEFKAYLMYKPLNGIWVPLRSANWFWEAGATNTGSCSWNRTKGDASDSVTSVDESDHPTWQGDIMSFIRTPPEPVQ